MTSKLLYVDGRLGGFTERLPRPKQLPEWLPASALDYFVAEFERTGFRWPHRYQ